MKTSTVNEKKHPFGFSMHKLGVVLLFSLLFFSAKAQPGLLSFVSNGGDRFWVYVNGVQINSEPRFYVLNIAVSSPQCHVRIVFENPRIPSIEKTVTLMDPTGRWYQASFFLRKVKRWLYIMSDADASYELLIPGYIYPSGGQQLLELQGHEGRENPRIPPSAPSQPTAPSPSPIPVPSYCMPMDFSAFEAAKTTIMKASFDDTKLSIAKQIASANCLTAAQIRDIMKLFSFESTRLDFAKFAYRYCYDKGNYFMVNDAFSFSSSIDELNQFIFGQ